LSGVNAEIVRFSALKADLLLYVYRHTFI